MPPIFKALASISAWFLFIMAWVTGLSTFMMGILSGALYGAQPPMVLPVFFAVAAAEAVLAVVVMRLRQKME